MQGTESDELGASAGLVPGPMVPVQVIQQRNALFEPFQILAHDADRSPRLKLRTLIASSQARMVGGQEKSRPQRRSGQKTWRKGNMVRQDKRMGPHSSCSPRSSHCSTVSRVRRRDENAGHDESRLRHHRRRVEESGRRSGSFRGGAALSQLQCSTKRRRSTSLRVTRL